MGATTRAGPTAASTLASGAAAERTAAAPLCGPQARSARLRCCSLCSVRARYISALEQNLSSVLLNDLSSSCAAGDRYEGEWADGREDGVGTAIGVDGSRFYGSWQAGKLHGKGVRSVALQRSVAS